VPSGTWSLSEREQRSSLHLYGDPEVKDWRQYCLAGEDRTFLEDFSYSIVFVFFIESMLVKFYEATYFWFIDRNSSRSVIAVIF
jgi:hypothetical protein